MLEYNENDIMEKVPWYNNMVKKMELPSYKDVAETIIDRFNVRKIIGNFDNYQMQTSIREVYLPRFGFPLLNKDFIDDLVKFIDGRKVLEIACGNGFLAKCLHDKGVSIIPTDNLSWETSPNIRGDLHKWKFYHYVDIEQIDYHKALDKYIGSVGVVLISWPVYGDSIAFNVLRKCIEYNVPLIYIGERYGGCTADDHFFVAIDNDKYKLTFDELSTKYISFFGLYDSCYVIQKRKGGE